MRNSLCALLLSVAGALGLAAIPSTASADARIYVDIGDVGFSVGRPYYRYDRTPLYVTYDRYRQPRFYRYGPRPAHRVGYYDPYYDSRVIVQPRVVYRDRYYRDGYRDRFWVDHHGRRHYRR